MVQSITFIDFLITVGITQGFCIALVILLAKYFKNSTNIYLGISMLILVLINIQRLLLEYNFYVDYPRLRILEDIELQLLFPITLYFYYQKSLNPEYQIKTKQRLWYIPFALSVLFNLFVGFDVYYKLYIIQDMSWVRPTAVFEYYFSVFLNLAVIAVVYFLIYKKKPQRPIAKTILKWIQLFYSFHIVLIIFWLITIISDKFFQNDLSAILWFLVNIMFFVIGYLGIFKFRLTNNRYEIRKIISHQEFETKQKAENKQVEQKQAENNHYQKMLTLFETDKIHRDSQLNRDSVAEKLGISVGYLSQIISQHSNKRFSDYLNYYRVEDVKRMILDSEFDNYSMLAIGLEAGFNSKSTFYNGFKKETGLTPSAYKNRFKQ
ncbi:helix-turn-helix domain-containing protein [uncultured Winogradskyella sp.]|uniref:AraC family transcriptional regulator n=1 Tax=uncultured Winogradskyella sp. TaxID=395353 RepID=UPI0026368581|nr:helix-turn-helix domain-containing protein [uncultured Winogradskyella sp.]